ncbi:hypothetical protein [Microbacterium sp. P01]|uniref:hypothetical protein n=1 Tax=unclassified Microbacterium TaxID=2609290 RepID=UPI0036718B4D
MSNTLDAILEIFAWVGLGVGIVLAVLALILHLADGTWISVKAVVEDLDEEDGPTPDIAPNIQEHRLVVRWFDQDGGVNQAPLTHEQHALLGSRGMVDIYTRRGWTNRMRVTPGSPAVRATVLLASGLFAVGMVSLVVSWIVLFARG